MMRLHFGGSEVCGCCGGKSVWPVVLKCVIRMHIYIVNKLRSVDRIWMDTVYRIHTDCSSVFHLLPPRKLLLIFLFNEIHVKTVGNLFIDITPRETTFLVSLNKSTKLITDGFFYVSEIFSVGLHIFICSVYLLIKLFTEAACFQVSVDQNKLL